MLHKIKAQPTKLTGVMSYGARTLKGKIIIVNLLKVRHRLMHCPPPFFGCVKQDTQNSDVLLVRVRPNGWLSSSQLFSNMVNLCKPAPPQTLWKDDSGGHPPRHHSKAGTSRRSHCSANLRLLWPSSGPRLALSSLQWRLASSSHHGQWHPSHCVEAGMCPPHFSRTRPKSRCVWSRCMCRLSPRLPPAHLYPGWPLCTDCHQHSARCISNEATPGHPGSTSTWSCGNHSFGGKLIVAAVFNLL